MTFPLPNEHFDIGIGKCGDVNVGRRDLTSWSPDQKYRRTRFWNDNHLFNIGATGFSQEYKQYGLAPAPDLHTMRGRIKELEEIKEAAPAESKVASRTRAPRVQYAFAKP